MYFPLFSSCRKRPVSLCPACPHCTEDSESKTWGILIRAEWAVSLFYCKTPCKLDWQSPGCIDQPMSDLSRLVPSPTCASEQGHLVTTSHKDRCWTWWSGMCVVTAHTGHPLSPAKKPRVHTWTPQVDSEGCIKQLSTARWDVWVMDSPLHWTIPIL